MDSHSRFCYARAHETSWQSGAAGRTPPQSDWVTALGRDLPKGGLGCEGVGELGGAMEASLSALRHSLISFEDGIEIVPVPRFVYPSHWLMLRTYAQKAGGLDVNRGSGLIRSPFQEPEQTSSAEHRAPGKRPLAQECPNASLQFQPY